mgnify:CR=1 FL=1
MKYLIYIAMILVCPVHLVAELPEIPVSKAGKKTIQIKAGRNQGVKNGMKLDVFRQEERVLHPITGEVLGSPKVKIAEVSIAKVFWNSSQGKMTFGLGYDWSKNTGRINGLLRYYTSTIDSDWVGSEPGREDRLAGPDPLRVSRL